MKIKTFQWTRVEVRTDDERWAGCFDFDKSGYRSGPGRVMLEMPSGERVEMGMDFIQAVFDLGKAAAKTGETE